MLISNKANKTIEGRVKAVWFALSEEYNGKFYGSWWDIHQYFWWDLKERDLSEKQVKSAIYRLFSKGFLSRYEVGVYAI